MFINIYECVYYLQTIQDMVKQAKVGKIVSEADIPPPIAVSASGTVSVASIQPPAVPADGVSRQTLSEYPTVSSAGPVAPSRQVPPAPGSIEIPRPTVIGGSAQANAVAPVPKPRTSVAQPGDSGPVPGSGVSAAKAAANAPPVHLHTRPASQQAADRGNPMTFVNIVIDYCVSR